MKVFGVCLSAALLSAMVATDASALPFDAAVAPAPSSPAQSSTVLARYGYGPLRYGLYGHRHRHHRRANGTGYYGRGTRTGGPAGGLPGRS